MKVKWSEASQVRKEEKEKYERWQGSSLLSYTTRLRENPCFVHWKTTTHQSKGHSLLFSEVLFWLIACQIQPNPNQGVWHHLWALMWSSNKKKNFVGEVSWLWRCSQKSKAISTQTPNCRATRERPGIRFPAKESSRSLLSCEEKVCFFRVLIISCKFVCTLYGNSSCR